MNSKIREQIEKLKALLEDSPEETLNNCVMMRSYWLIILKSIYQRDAQRIVEELLEETKEDTRERAGYC